jgi:hypothetical protein
MLRRANVLLKKVPRAPPTYPFPKPFYDTPYDEDRVLQRAKTEHRDAYPQWMDNGIDGSGLGAGMYRPHPLSKDMKSNLSRSKWNVPHIYDRMLHGFHLESGEKKGRKGKRIANPSRFPYLTGEPCPVFGWKITAPEAIRTFEVPAVDIEKIRYKPYVALNERKMMEKSGVTSEEVGIAYKDETAVAKQDEPDTKAPKDKPLLKKLFFWR